MTTASSNEITRARSPGLNLFKLAMQGFPDLTPGRQPPAEQTQYRDVPDQAGGSFHDNRGVRQSGTNDRADAHDTNSTLPGSQSQSVELKISKNESVPQAGDHVSTAFKQHPATETYHGQDTPSPRRPVLQSTSAPVDNHRTEVENIIKADQAALRMKDNEIAALQRHIQESTHRYEQQLHAARAELSAASGQIQHQAKNLEDMRRRCQRGDGELRKLKTLLEDRAEEVKVAQAFMTTADKYSVAEVSQMVEQLNDEIYQCAMDLSDAVVDQSIISPEHVHDEDWKHRLEYAHRHWNADIIARLQLDLSRDEPDTTLFECLVQCVLVTWCLSIIEAFCPYDQGINNYLWDLWDDIADSHETPIARNWLAITCSGLRLSGQPPDGKSSMRQLDSVLVLTARKPPSKSWLKDTIGVKLDQMAAKALTVKEAMTEGVLSADLHVFTYAKDKSFKPAEMRDAYEKPSRPRPCVPGGNAESRGERIFCSTGLGIRRITREARSSTSSSVRRKKEVLLKPKVLLYSTLDE